MSLFDDNFLSLAKNGQWDDVKRKFQYYSNRNEWASLHPAKSEILDFLATLTNNLENDGSYYLYSTMPSLKGRRVEAIKDLHSWVDSVPKSSFPHTDINPYRVAFQLAVRVLWPDSLNQGQFGFCGPTTVLFTFIKRYPRVYVKCGMDLIENGTGYIQINQGSSGIRVSLLNTEAGSWKTKGLPEADFIILRAIRKEAKNLVKGSESGGIDFLFTNKESFATTPQQIESLLIEAGYSDVIDMTLAWPGQGGVSEGASETTKNYNMINCMRRLRTVNAKPVIIMLVAVEMADRVMGHTVDPTGSRWNKTTALHGLHWVIVDKLTFSGNDVSVGMTTWKVSKDFTCSKGQFLELYHGFVCGSP